jgi:large repetitive protein
MRALAIAVVLGVAAPAWANVTISKAARVGQGYVGGMVGYDINMQANGLEQNLVIHDPTPAGHTLLTVVANGNPVDCTQSSGGTFGVPPFAVTVTCNVGGELQVAVPNAPSDMAVVVTYRVDSLPAGGMSSNTASVTCSPGTCGQTSTATIPIVVAPLTIGKSVDKTTAAPGESLSYTVTVQNGGSAEASGFTVRDVLPAGLTFKSITVRGATFTDANLAQAAMPPTSTTITRNGSTLDLSPPPLPAGQTFTALITADIDAAATNGTTYSNSAQVTAPGGSAVTSPSVVTTVNVAMMFPDFQKTLSTSHAKIGETVRYSLTVTPRMPTAGPITLIDPFAQSLQVTEVKLGGSIVSCGATPVTSGPFQIDCGSDGRTLRLVLPAGQTLSAPITVEVAAQVLQTAGTEILNTAHLDVAGTGRDASASLTVDNAPTSGASV